MSTCLGRLCLSFSSVRLRRSLQIQPCISWLANGLAREVGEDTVLGSIITRNASQFLNFADVFYYYLAKQIKVFKGKESTSIAKGLGPPSQR